MAPTTIVELLIVGELPLNLFKLLIASLAVTSVTYGLLLAEVATYYRACWRATDYRAFKVLVAIITVLCTALLGHIASNLTVLLSIRLGDLGQVPVNAALSTSGRALLAAVVFGTQGFFMFRAWQVTTSRWVKVLGAILWFTYCGAVLAVAVLQTFRRRRVLGRSPGIDWIAFWANFVVSLFATSILAQRLHYRSQNGLRPSNDTLSSLTSFALRTSGLTCIISLAAAICSSLTGTNAYIAYLFFHLYPPASCLCVVHTLNQRPTITSEGAPPRFALHSAWEDPATWRGDFVPHLMAARTSSTTRISLEREVHPRNAQVQAGVIGAQEADLLLNLEVFDKLEPAKFGPTSPKSQYRSRESGFDPAWSITGAASAGTGTVVRRRASAF